MVVTFSEMIGLITSGPVLAFEIMGSDAVNQWQALAGPGDSAVARSEAPLSLRAKFGSGMLKGCVQPPEKSRYLKSY